MLMLHTMGASSGLAVTSIMIGLSRALKATVEGLLVIIPCVVMNNILQAVRERTPRAVRGTAWIVRSIRST